MKRLVPAVAGGAVAGAPPSLGDAALRMPRLTRRLAGAHGALFRHAHGRAFGRWFGAPVLVLETVGRRTGRPRATPLVYVPDGDDLVVVPANAGADRPPAWWLNLQAAGAGIAILRDDRRRVAPRVAAGAERERLWRRVADVAPLEHYQRRTSRWLPVVILERR
jgi:deazaflavin-dependent oxidoreductase (nitroreductase family)